jgi:hypothetical protein
MKIVTNIHKSIETDGSVRKKSNDKPKRNLHLTTLPCTFSGTVFEHPAAEYYFEALRRYAKLL